MMGLMPRLADEQHNEWQRFDVIEATYNPKALETLRPRARAGIGERRFWRCLWPIEEEDGGPYVGQHAWEWIADPDAIAPVVKPYIGWAPTEDLDDIKVVRLFARNA